MMKNERAHRQQQYLDIFELQPWVRTELKVEVAAQPSVAAPPVTAPVAEPKVSPVAAQIPATPKETVQQITPPPKPKLVITGDDCVLPVALQEGPSDSDRLIILDSMPKNPYAWRLLDNMLKAIDWHRSDVRVLVLSSDDKSTEQQSFQSLCQPAVNTVLLFKAEQNDLQLPIFSPDIKILSTISLDTLLNAPEKKGDVYQQLLSVLFCPNTPLTA